jgi:hypothetical protein
MMCAGVSPYIIRPEYSRRHWTGESMRPIIDQ